MSAYLTSNDTISALVTYWGTMASRGCSTSEAQLSRCYSLAKRAQNGGEGWYFDWASSEVDALRKSQSLETVVFNHLLQENVNSLQARYPDSPEMWSGAKVYRLRRSAQVSRWINYRPLGQGHLVGMVRGYEYQSCEHDGWEKSVAYQICQQIRQFLLQDLEARDCGDRTCWASYEEPSSTDSAPVSLSALLEV